MPEHTWFEPPTHPRAVGDRSEGAVLAELLKRGCTVLLPVGGGTRYDLVVADGDGFLRVQVKTGRIEDGAVSFPVCSSDYVGRKRDYHGHCDLFAVYVPTANQVYFVPVAHCGRSQARLRLAPPRNGQKKAVRWARDYVDFPTRAGSSVG